MCRSLASIGPPRRVGQLLAMDPRSGSGLLWSLVLDRLDRGLPRGQGRMTEGKSLPGFEFVDLLPADVSARTLRADARAGLTAGYKWLPPKWFYDEVGSQLFEEITRLPEYYPTRAERDALRGACAALARHYPGLRITAVRADFDTQLELLPVPPGGGRRLVAFLGGTTGNLAPVQRSRFLRGLRDQLRPGEHLPLGADLVKSASVLVSAYDDAAGVTAAFNLNLLDVLNHRLAADFDRCGFDHVVVWDAEQEWIEMRLRARWRQPDQLL